jgi:hypothetical protein
LDLWRNCIPMSASPILPILTDVCIWLRIVSTRNKTYLI